MGGTGMNNGTFTDGVDGVHSLVPLFENNGVPNVYLNGLSFVVPNLIVPFGAPLVPGIYEFCHLITPDPLLYLTTEASHCNLKRVFIRNGAPSWVNAFSNV